MTGGYYIGYPRLTEIIRTNICNQSQAKISRDKKAFAMKEKMINQTSLKIKTFFLKDTDQKRKFTD